MAAEIYIRKSTWMHGLNPLVKVIGLFMLLAVPFSVSHPLYVLIPFAVSALLAFSAGAAKTIWRVKWLIFVFFALSLVLWSLFTRDGDALWILGGITITRKGVLFGLTVGLRLNTFFLAAIATLSSTPPEDVVYALGRLGIPYPFAFAMTLSFRLVPLFMETVGTVVTAQKARGLDLESGGIVTRARRFVPVLLPVLFLAILRTNRLAMALESKAFGPGIKRTQLAEHKLGWGDVLAIVVIIGLAASAIIALALNVGRL